MRATRSGRPERKNRDANRAPSEVRFPTQECHTKTDRRTKPTIDSTSSASVQSCLAAPAILLDALIFLKFRSGVPHESATQTMVSLKFSMSKRAGSTVPQFRIRVPTKIVDRLRGKRVLLSMSPPDDYRSSRPPDAELRVQLRELANARRRFGYRRLFVLLRQHGEPSGLNRIYRLYREEGLSVRKRRGSPRSAPGRRSCSRPGQMPVGRWILSMTSLPMGAGSGSSTSSMT